MPARRTIRVYSMADSKCRAWNGGRCMPANPGGNSMFTKSVMYPMVLTSLQRERHKCRQAIDLGNGGEGWRHAEPPPPAPKPEAVFSHIHPWIFSPL
jgi:hypothetical protein